MEKKRDLDAGGEAAEISALEVLELGAECRSAGISQQELAHLAHRQLHGPCLHQKSGCSGEQLACLEEAADLAATLERICSSDPEPVLVEVTNYFSRASVALGWQMED